MVLKLQRLESEKLKEQKEEEGLEGYDPFAADMFSAGTLLFTFLDASMIFQNFSDLKN